MNQEEISILSSKIFDIWGSLVKDILKEYYVLVEEAEREGKPIDQKAFIKEATRRVSNVQENREEKGKKKLCEKNS